MSERRYTINKLASACFILLFIMIGVFVVKAYLSGHFNSKETLQQYIASFGVFAPVILILVQGIQVVFPVLPGFFGCFVGAAMFGTAGGFWCNYIGISAGSIIAFFLARHYGTNIVKRIFTVEQYDKYSNWVANKKSYTWLLFWSILLPLAPDDFLCYFSGLAKMSALKFIAIIVIAKPWCILVYSYFFNYIF